MQAEAVHDSHGGEWSPGLRCFCCWLQPATAPAGYKVRAIGDSVTAGFGYCGTGDSHCGSSQDTQWSTVRLPVCASGPHDDRCSSNFGNPTAAGSNVSWTAQFAHREGVQDFGNLAVSGSTPTDWDSGGQFNSRLDQVVGDKPNLTLMTLGANPILKQFTTGSGVPCILFGSADQVGACARRVLADNQSQQHLQNVYSRLLSVPQNHVVVLLYHNPVPTAAAALNLRPKVAILMQQINEMVQRAVSTTVAQFPGRITVLNPGSSPWGLDHQCTPVQALMVSEWYASLGRHGLSPRKTSTPWVLSNDLCTHPTIAGYEQFVASVIAWFQSRPGAAIDTAVAGAPPPLLRVSYQAVQISSGHPPIEIVLSEPAHVVVRISSDRCLEEEITHPKACEDASRTHPPSRRPRVVAFQGHAGAQKLVLPVGDGFYDVSVTATGRDGRRETQTVQLIDDTKQALLAEFGGRKPR